jgi:ATP-dependent DNA ligase
VRSRTSKDIAAGSYLGTRNAHDFKAWLHLADEIAHVTRCRTAVIDGEICDADGGSNFYHLFLRDRLYSYAFDLLSVNGKHLREVPLLERKRRLQRVVSYVSRLLYLDHVEQRGVDLFRVACERDP